MRGLGLLVGLQMMMRAAAIIARRGRSSLISAPWLKDNLGDPKLRVLDVTQVLDRTTNTVAPAVDTYMTSHVPGARFVDVAGRLSTPDPKLHNLAPSPEQFAAELSRQVLHQSTELHRAEQPVSRRARLVEEVDVGARRQRLGKLTEK